MGVTTVSQINPRSKEPDNIFMLQDYSTRLQQLTSRYNPENSRIVEERMFSNEYSYDADVARYVKRAMSAVDVEYTKKTKEAGEMAKCHISEAIRDVSFEYQGSVMTDTHIRGASDIDLLVLCDKFYGTDIDKVREEIQKPEHHTYTQLTRLIDYSNSFSLYQGNSFEDLRQLRASIEGVMCRNYSICDISKPKAVKITNQHLHRDVDVVTSSWFQSLSYVLNGRPKDMRGIKIYNKDLGYAEGPDFPFLSISRINERSAATEGRLKKMIRFLKNVREDSGEGTGLTSFEINAICYSIPPSEYAYLNYKELVPILWSNMYHLWHDNKQNELKSVVGDEFVFKGKPDKVDALKKLEDEVFKIKSDLFNE